MESTQSGKSPARVRWTHCQISALKWLSPDFYWTFTGLPPESTRLLPDWVDSTGLLPDNVGDCKVLDLIFAYFARYEKLKEKRHMNCFCGLVWVGHQKWPLPEGENAAGIWKPEQQTLWIANRQEGGYLKLSCPSFTFSLELDAGCGIIKEKRCKRMSKLCCSVGKPKFRIEGYVYQEMRWQKLKSQF